MKRNIETLRNIGIIAHIDAGKTTVTERMLFLSGAKHKVGRVDFGTTTTDDNPEEQERGITIYAACVTFPWKEVQVNLLDTPGHVDFTAEVERCLRVLDGAVVVFSAREGVEAQSETVWRQANKYEVPRVAFINKMDREGANFERVLGQMTDRLHATPVPIEIPLGQGPPHVNNPFRGVIDLIRMKLLTYKLESEGREFEVGEIPEEAQLEAESWRENLLDKLYDHSPEMMDLALAEQPIPEELIIKTLRTATLAHKIQPVLCGSALHGIGVQPLLDAVAAFLPAPSDLPAVKGFDPIDKKHPEIKREPNEKEPFCGLVFKILPAKTGDLYWIRVYSGVLKANSRVLVPSLDKKENVAQLWQIHATRKDRDGQIEQVGAGDIVGVIGPRYAVTGDTLCDTRDAIQLESICFPQTVIEMAIEPESTAERKKLAETLEMLKRQDPTFKAAENEETGQTLISGMGELHLEVIKNRLLRDFALDVKVHKPRVSYRETVQKGVEVVGECHRNVAGQQLFAKVKLRLEPFAGDMKPRASNAVFDESLTPEFIEAVMQELRSRVDGGGPIGSFPLVHLKVTLIGGEMNLEQSNAMAFSIAAAQAFEEGLRQAGPVLLEPIMKLVITTPDEYYGDFVADLAQRRSRIVETDSRGGVTAIESHAPLAELFGYSGAMRSLSQGRAGASMEPLEYQPAPESVAASFAM